MAFYLWRSTIISDDEVEVRFLVGRIDLVDLVADGLILSLGRGKDPPWQALTQSWLSRHIEWRPIQRRKIKTHAQGLSPLDTTAFWLDRLPLPGFLWSFLLVSFSFFLFFVLCDLPSASFLCYLPKQAVFFQQISLICTCGWPVTLLHYLTISCS